MFFKMFLNSFPANENAFIMLHLIKIYSGLPAVSSSPSYSQNKIE